MVPFAAVDNLSRKLGIEPRRLLRTVGIPDRTAARRKKHGFLAPEEADRLLRVARVVEEAAHPLLGDLPPRELLDSGRRG